MLSLHGDFTQGGNYVQAWVALPKTKLDTLSFWVNAPVGSKRLPIRFMDANDQVHQINLKLNEKGGWQQLVLPLDDFFKKMGTSSALDIVAGYETWDGAKDREKHQKQQQPSPNLAILASRAMETTKGTVLISDVLFHPSVQAASIQQTIPLDKMLQEGELDWGFNLGQEFAGAKGGLDLVRDQPEPGKNAMRLHADFTGGGAYVGVRKSFVAAGCPSDECHPAQDAFQDNQVLCDPPGRRHGTVSPTKGHRVQRGRPVARRRYRPGRNRRRRALGRGE